MKIQKVTVIDAPPDRVWEVLGPRYTEADRWASSVHVSAGRGGPGVDDIAGAPARGRVCETSLGQFEETVVHYDESAREVAYTAQGEKMPFFVKRMLNSWNVEAEGPDQARVTMALEVSLAAPFNVLMALPMRMQLGGVLREAHEELKHFVETDGVPHPRKVKAQAKYQSAAAAV